MGTFGQVVGSLGMVAAAILISGCSGLTQSPAHGLTFSAPPGFTSKASVMGVMQVWTHDDGREVLFLMRLPASVDISSALKSADFNDTKILARKSIKICGHQAATALVMAGSHGSTSSTGPRDDDRVDVVSTQASSESLIAIYAYPKTARPEPAAQAALRNLCSKPGSAAD